MAEIITDTNRVRILDYYRQRLDADYGPNSAKKWFRFVRRLPWRPGNSIRPALWVVDDGQDASETWEPDDSRQFILKYKLILDLAANWSDPQTVEDWTDRVQSLIIFLLKNRYASWAVMKHEYKGDEPVTVVLSDGASEAIWVVDFESTYAQAIA